MKTCAVIVAAGLGTRMGCNAGKSLIKLEQPMIIHTLDAFQKNSFIDDIVLVINETEKPLCEQEIEKHGISKVKSVVIGGKTRQSSSFNGVFASDADIILIHDGARPFVSQECITNSIRNAAEHGASALAVPAKDTIKKAAEGFVEQTINRNMLWITQTPQAFKKDIIREAHEKAKHDSFTGTDDAMLVERLGYKVKITMGHYDNIKITTPDDLAVAEKILKQRGADNV